MKRIGEPTETPPAPDAGQPPLPAPYPGYQIGQKRVTSFFSQPFLTADRWSGPAMTGDHRAGCTCFPTLRCSSRTTPEYTPITHRSSQRRRHWAGASTSRRLAPDNAVILNTVERDQLRDHAQPLRPAQATSRPPGDGPRLRLPERSQRRDGRQADVRHQHHLRWRGCHPLQPGRDHPGSRHRQRGAVEQPLVDAVDDVGGWAGATPARARSSSRRARRRSKRARPNTSGCIRSGST